MEQYNSTLAPMRGPGTAQMTAWIHLVLRPGQHANSGDGGVAGGVRGGAAVMRGLAPGACGGVPASPRVCGGGDAGRCRLRATARRVGGGSRFPKVPCGSSNHCEIRRPLAAVARHGGPPAALLVGQFNNLLVPRIHASVDGILILVGY